jgi:Protein of unknown function (DUF3822)
MEQQLFDIVNEQTILQPPQCTLLVQVGSNFLNYAVVHNNTRQVLCLRYRNFISAEATPNKLELIEHIQQDEFLQQSFRQVVLVYSTPESIMVPEALYNIGHTKTMLDVVYGNLQKGAILSEKVQGWHMYNVYRVPPHFQTALQVQYPQAKCWHHHSLLLQQWDKADAERTDKIAVTFNHNSMQVVVFKNKQLQLVQQYAYSHAEDVAYYLLQCFHTHQLSPAENKLMVDGLIEADSNMYRELDKYFANIHLQQTVADIHLPLPALQYPQHYFSPLLKMMVCVL